MEKLKEEMRADQPEVEIKNVKDPIIEDSPELIYVKKKFPILSNTQLQSNLKNVLISKWEEMAKQDEEKNQTK